MIQQPAAVCLLGLNSQYVHAAPAPWCLKAGLKACARARFDASVVEGSVNEPLPELLARVVRTGPRVLGISCYIWNIACVSALLPALRAALPDCVIVLGGPEVSYRARDALARYPQADYVLCGEGERPFAQLLDALCGLGDKNEVPGLCFRTQEGFHLSPPYAHPDTQPSPVDADYLAAVQGRIAYLETSRGCPYACAFCLSGRGEPLRKAPLEQAFRDLLLLANAGARTVKLVDRTFNADRARAARILRFIADRAGTEIPEGLAFHFEIAGDLLDEETLQIVARAPAGLFQFEIGLQSMDEATLLRVRRRTDMALLSRQVARLIASGRAHVHLDLIAGLPGEGLSAFACGFNRAYALRPHALQLGFLKLIHGAAMREEREAYPCAFSEAPPYEVQATPWLDEKDLETLRTAERGLDKAHNSGRFRGTLRFLTEEQGLAPFSLFLALGTAIRRAEAEAGSLPLDKLTALVFDCLRELLPGQEARLRDLMLEDRLASTKSAVLPAFLKSGDRRYHALKRALDRRFPRPAGALRVCGILYAPEDEAAVFCDYTNRDPVSGLYPLTRAALKDLL